MVQPKGFWSYARGDDAHLDGVLTELRGRIAGEVSMLLGHDVGIFQDIHDLRTGDRWAEVLRAGVTKASFLIPVLTPRFFNRDWCREEVLTYMRISEENGVEPRIFPIRFVEWDEDKDCEVRAALAPFQYKDLSNWRFESDPTQKAKLLHEFARDVKARLKVAPAPRPVAAAVVEVKATGSVKLESREAKPGDAPRYKTYVVDPIHRGDFTTIGAAIAAAEPGSKIVVREGTYREALRLSKPLEIVGEGDRERIVVVTATDDALHCDAPMARISGMRFCREVGGLDFGIQISGGAVEIDDCVVESLSWACVGISGAGSSPSLRRCIARDGKQDGYIFVDGAGGVMDRCEAVGNGHSGVLIVMEADPMLRDCVLRGNSLGGAKYYTNGRGRLEGCVIEANGGAGVDVGKGGAPEVTGCTIKSNAYQAVWIRDAASGGVFRGNDLRGNQRGAWDIADGAEVTREDNRE